MIKGVYTIVLLILSNSFMMLAWYGHLKFGELKVIQEVITLLIFTVFSVLFFKNENFRFNHLIGFVFLILAVYFIFKK